MDKQHKITATLSLLETWGLISTDTSFLIDESLLSKYRDAYNSVCGTVSDAKFDKRRKQYDRISSLNLMQYKSERKLSITEGYVYIISNPAWPKMYKVGMTVNPASRLASYQTYSPLRDFKLEHYQFSSNRREAEKKLHKLLEATKVAGEWFVIEDLLAFKEKLNQYIYY